MLKFLVFILAIVFTQRLLGQTLTDFQLVEKSFQKKKFEEFEKQAINLYKSQKRLPPKTLLQWAYISEEKMNYPLAVYLLMFVHKHVQQRELKEKAKDLIESKNLKIPGETFMLQELSFFDYAIRYLRYINLVLVALCFLLVVQMINNTRKGRSFSYRPIILAAFVAVLLALNNLLVPTSFALVSADNCIGYVDQTSASKASTLLEKGTIVEVVNTDREWTRIKLGNKDCWVKSATLFNLFDNS